MSSMEVWQKGSDRSFNFWDFYIHMNSQTTSIWDKNKQRILLAILAEKTETLKSSIKKEF